MKKTVTIQCINKNYYGPCCYFVTVCRKNRIVYKGFTNNFGCIQFNLACCKLYTLQIFSNMMPYCINTKIDIFTSKCLNTPLIFIFEENIFPISIKVTDKYYNGLPIEKGVLNLWHKSIQFQ